MVFGHRPFWYIMVADSDLGGVGRSSTIAKVQIVRRGFRDLVNCANQVRSYRTVLLLCVCVILINMYMMCMVAELMAKKGGCLCWVIN